jgi:hypothetical protein
MTLTPFLLLFLTASYVPCFGLNSSGENPSSKTSLQNRVIYPGVSFDTNPVVFHFQEETFKIPRNYLIGGSDKKSENDHKNFSLLVTLPDLQPIEKNNEEKFFPIGFGDLIRVLVTNKRSWISRNDYFNQIFSGRESEKKVIARTAEGLDVYELHGAPSGNIYVERNEAASVVFLMTCDFDNSENKYKMCDVFSRLNKDTSIYYFFSKKYQYLAPGIDARIKSLINSFLNK